MKRRDFIKNTLAAGVGVAAGVKLVDSQIDITNQDVADGEQFPQERKQHKRAMFEPFAKGEVVSFDELVEFGKQTMNAYLENSPLT